MINDTLFMMLVVGLIISFALLLLFIWGARNGQFDDSNKMVEGLLYDSVDDLNDAIRKEQKLKEAKEAKLKESQKSEENQDNKKS